MVAALVVGLVANNAAVAQQPVGPAEWQFSLTPYFWAAGLSGTAATSNPHIPSQNIQVGFGELLSEVDAIPYMGAAQLCRGRFCLAADLMVLSTKTSFATRNVLFRGGMSEMTELSATILGFYRVLVAEDQWLDLGAGVRPWDTTSRLTFHPGLLPGFSKSFSVSWADPLIAVRYHLDLDERFGLTGYADIGGFGVASRITWQVFGTLDYRATDWLVLSAGYRHLQTDHTAIGIRTNLGQSGPILAATFRF